MVEIIAEFCQNHQGNPELVWQMLDQAAQAGASHVKLQTIYADQLAWRPQFEQGLHVGDTVACIRRPFQAEFDRLSNLELGSSVYSEFVARAQDLGLVPMTTCFARCQIPEIIEQGFQAIKVASYDCASYQLLRELAAAFNHVYVSTGATFDDEIEFATKILSAAHNLTLLHCTTIYPTPLDALNLSRMEWLSGFAKRVGFSDHTLVSRDSTVAAKAAIALGADVVERHFTILDPDETKDGPVSINPDQLADLVTFSSWSSSDQLGYLRSIGVDLITLQGTPTRDLSHTELLNRDYYRGRFGSPRHHGSSRSHEVIFNWEEIPVDS